jgi:5-methylcytosine-specific restriction endonuclease McrA
VEENRAKVRETKLAWNSRNPEYVRAMKKRLRPATPAWADLEAIALVYQAARQATVDSGIQHEVDHIIPIRGRAVCGLHVAWNLRVVAASVNRRKSNKFDDVICS